MPYIANDKRRAQLEQALEVLTFGGMTDGETVFCMFYLMVHKLHVQKATFEYRSRVAGLATSLDQEFRRRFLAGYEGSKLLENGDVLPRMMGLDNE